MKNFFIFVFSLLLGIALYAGYKKFYYVKPKPVIKANLLKPSQFSLEHAPENSLVGTMVTMSGNVAIQSRIATESARIIVPVPVQQGEKVETKDDGIVDIQLGESTISMPPYSDVEFIQTLPTAIMLRQEGGKVSYKTVIDQPLGIRSMHLLTNLHEGMVTITVDTDKQTVRVAVKEGSVTVGFNDNEFITNVLTIAGGEEYIFDDEEREGTVKKINPNF